VKRRSAKFSSVRTFLFACDRHALVVSSKFSLQNFSAFYAALTNFSPASFYTCSHTRIIASADAMAPCRSNARRGMMTFDWLLHVLAVLVAGLLAAVLWIVANQDFSR